MAIMEGISPLNLMMDNTRELARKKWSGRVVKHRLELIESLLLMKQPDAQAVADRMKWFTYKFCDEIKYDESRHTAEQIGFSKRFASHFSRTEIRRVESLVHAVNKSDLREKILKHFKERKAEVEQYL